MPNGKPAGVPCVQLDAQGRCRLFGKPERPSFCAGLQPSNEMCGTDRTYAMHWLTALEHATQPGAADQPPAASSISVCSMPSST